MQTKIERADEGNGTEGLAAIQAAVGAEATVDGAAALLRYVYTSHPPKKPTLTPEALAGLTDGSKSSASANVKKALLKAQRDYHPDRNQDMVRETLGCSQEEWEVLSSAICQELASAYDVLFKGERS